MTARLLPAERRRQSLAPGIARPSPAGCHRTAVRRPVGTSPETVEPTPEDAVIAIQLGGTKDVRRCSDGKVTVHDVRVGGLTFMPALQANRASRREIAVALRRGRR